MAKRRTHEEFIELVNDINPNIEIIGKYVNAKTKIECKKAYCFTTVSSFCLENICITQSGLVS